VKFSRKAVTAAVVIVVAAGIGRAALQRGGNDTACERYQAVAQDVERAERGRGDMTFEESQRRLAEAYAACLQAEESAATGG
jgi:hypothetical protein